MKVIESLKNEPEKWQQNSHTLRHENGAEIWTDDGALCINMYPSICISLVSKFKLWRAVRKWGENAPIEAFKKNLWDE